MDDSERSQELLDSVDISQLRTDVVKLSAAEQSIKTDEEGEPPPELINSQYINIHRVPETLGKTLVDCNSPAPQALISGELMSHHIVHGGMVVDMMAPPPVSSADFSQHTAQYIPEHYDADDDLLSHELTEEDRRLAAALVAVQIVQQEKQQHPSVVASESNVIVSPNGLTGLMTSAGHLTGKVHVPVSISDHSMTTMSPLSPSAGVPDEKPGMEAMVSSYIQAVEEEAAVGVAHLDQQGDRLLKMYQPGPPPPHAQELRLPPLPPLKKVLSSQSMAIRSGYSRSTVSVHEATEVHLGDSQITSEPQHQTLDGSDVRVVDPSHLSETDELLKVEYDVKSEGIDDDLGEESDDNPQDDNDSDYDIESDLRPSRRSLPHKKRIPRKLKNPKKASPLRSGEKCYKCTKCGEQFVSQSLLASHKLIHMGGKRMFNCELCGKGFANQLKFFEHLKSHYEPSPGVNLHEQAISKGIKEKISPPKELNLKQETEKHIVEAQDSLMALPPPLVCNQCGKSFRRQKAFESHVNIAHPKQEEIEEFSEPEDLMEGIQVSVDAGEGDTDDGDMDCLTSSSIVRSLKNNNDKDWYREEDLHAAEADLQEMEQQQQHHHQQQQQQQLQHAVEHDNVCELCGEVFDNKRQFDEHFREEHMEFIDPSDPTVKDFQGDPEIKDEGDNTSKKRVIGKKSRRSGMHLTCPQCGRMFNHRNSLVYHLRSHSGERPHQCEVCGKSFFAASALKVHMRLHSGDKPYKCEFCGRYFRQYGDLKYHCTSIHSEEKNYQCEYCGKDFARKYSLIVHRRIHTGEKNYKCEFCGKSFRASSYLQNHRRIHTGEKPHPCEVCGKPFRVRSDMKRHLNTHNRDRQRNTGSNGAASANGGNSNSNSNSNSAMSECPSLRAMLEDTGKLKSEPEEEQLDPNSLQTAHISVEQPMTEMSVADIGLQNGGPESILPDEALSEQQPINLNIAVPAPSGTTRQATHHQLTAAQAVPEEVLHHYARDPLESVRDGNNTLYVWPIYMA